MPNYSITVKVISADGQEDTKTYTGVTYKQVSVLPKTLPNGFGVTSYSYSGFEATGGKTPYSWSLVSGNLSTYGLSVNSAGVLSGTVSVLTEERSINFRLRATDVNGRYGEQDFTLTLIPKLAITTESIPVAIVGKTYSTTIQAVNGHLPYTFSAPSGLPSGLSINSAGVISGTKGTIVSSPESNNHNIKVVSTDSQEYTKAILFRSVNQLAIASTALPNASLGSYSYQLSYSGGYGDNTWEVQGLPTGLSCSSSGLITGTPTSLGSWSGINIKVTDKAFTGYSGQEASGVFSLLVADPVSIITSSITNQTNAGSYYSQTFTGTGGYTNQYVWSIDSGNIPTGLQTTQSGNTFVIYGNSSALGTFNFNVKLTDGTTSDIKSYYIQVGSTLAITTTSIMTNKVVGSVYSQQFSGSGGTSPYTWSISSGTIPPGTSLSSTGLLSGSPSVSNTYNFTVRLSDQYTYVTKAFSCYIYPPVQITSPSQLPTGRQWETYPTTTFVATGGIGPYQWQYSGSISAGLTFSGNTLSGKPLVAGTYSILVTATDSQGNYAQKSYSLIVSVGDAIIITTASPLTDAEVGTAYSLQFASSGGGGASKWEATGLPTGFSLTTAGRLSGTATAAFTATIVVTVTGVNGSYASKSFSLKAVQTGDWTGSIKTQLYGTFLNGMNGGTTNANTNNAWSTSVGAGNSNAIRQNINLVSGGNGKSTSYPANNFTVISSQGGGSHYINTSSDSSSLNSKTTTSGIGYTGWIQTVYSGTLTLLKTKKVSVYYYQHFNSNGNNYVNNTLSIQCGLGNVNTREVTATAGSQIKIMSRFDYKKQNNGNEWTYGITLYLWISGTTYQLYGNTGMTAAALNLEAGNLNIWVKSSRAYLVGVTLT